MNSMQLSVFASFEVRPLQPVLEYWLQRLGWDCTLEFLPAFQLFQQLLTPSEGSEMDLVLAREQDLGPDGQEELERILARRARPCLVYVDGGRPGHPIARVEWLDPNLLALYAPIDCDKNDSELPFSQSFYAALATAVARTLTPTLVKPIKLLVVDADNTLWDGVVAEDGLEGVVVGPERRAFQNYLKQRVAAGCLLAVCSKNSREDVELVFRQHPEMVLECEQVLAWLVGWEFKSAQILRLLEELNLGLESVLVFDDNALEVAELRACRLQAIQVPQAAGLLGLIDHLWWFADKPATAEDSRRNLAYRQQLERNQHQSQAPDLAEFLAGLELNIRIQPIGLESRERASQLTYRTNQFHLAPRNRLESDLLQPLGVWVSDRFGDYGLVGLMDFQLHSDQLLVETFLLSCRSLGRGVEHAMLRHLGEMAGPRPLKLLFRATERNQPAAQFLAQVLGRDAEEGWNPLDSSRASQSRWTPAAPPRAKVSEQTLKGACPELCRVAEQGWRAEHILKALLPAERRPRPRLSTAYVEPAQERQAQVAAVWTEVLAIEPIGLHDGFFELGGDSLAMVRVLARLQEQWDWTPGLDQFLRNPTVEGLAEAPIETVASPSLEWVQDLSDHEVEALLAQLQAPTAIESLVIPTAGRPHAVARAVASFHQHLRQAGRNTRLIVSDQSPPQQSEETRQLLGQMAQSLNLDLLYLGATEHARLKELLIGKGFEPELLTFTLGGAELSGCGSNRNLLSLVAGSTRYFSIDDDVLASPLIFGDLAAPLRLGPGPEAEDVFFSHAPGSEAIGSQDLLGLHESLLGRLRAELVDPSPALPRSLAPDGWVAATFNGLTGDCGLAAPFGLWEEPLGLLALNEASQRALLESESNYRSALLSRRHLRLAPVPTLSDGAGSLSTFVAVDNTRLIPPWWPALRGEDRLFPVLISAIHPNALFGHLPVAAPHEPMTERRFSVGELFRNSGGIDLCRLMLEAVQLWKPVAVEAPEARLAALGAHLEELARGDFQSLLLDQIRERNQIMVARLLDRQGPSWWRADLEEYCRRQLLAQQRADYWIPMDVQARVGSRAGEQTGRLLGLFGRMLKSWPELVRLSQELELSRLLSQPLQLSSSRNSFQRSG